MGFASAKGKSLSEIYSGSNAERRVDESRRNYAPSARENARVFGGEKTKREFSIGDIIEIIIDKNTNSETPTEPAPSSNGRIIL